MQGDCLNNRSSMTDPILIAIDKHRRAREQHLAALGETETICDDRIGPACEAEISSWDELLATKPTTLAGLQAFLEYVETWQAQDDGIYGEQFIPCRDFGFASRTNPVVAYRNHIFGPARRQLRHCTRKAQRVGGRLAPIPIIIVGKPPNY